MMLVALERERMDRSSDWMNQAKSDLEHAKSDLNGGFYEWACFSAQQAAEKAVKAVFQKLRKDVWGHSVAGLIEELMSDVTIPEGLYEAALELDKAYIPTRYPNAHPRGAPHWLYTRSEAERLIGYAEEIIKFCEGVLASL